MSGAEFVIVPHHTIDALAADIEAGYQELAAAKRAQG